VIQTIEIVVFRKAGGPLTKVIRLEGDKPFSDGAACIMSAGTARRLRFDRLDQFAQQIERLNSSEAIAAGALRADLPDQVDVVTQQKLNGDGGTHRPHQ
jgi:hypothetical protein